MDASVSPRTPIPPVLVLSTGRCGSTLVSQILNRHPEVLSVSEFFTALGPKAFAVPRPDGAHIWRLCTRQNPLMRAVLKHGLLVDEFVYPFDGPGARFGLRDVPAISLMTLPHFTAEPDALFDELGPVVRSQPRLPLAEHYRRLFDHLAQRFRRKVWVERSGGSLMHTAKLLRLFPDARVIHVYRDGRDTAMSMHRHHMFRVVLAAMRGFRLDPERMIRAATTRRFELPLYELIFRLVDPVKLMQRARLSTADFGAFWSTMITTSHEVLQPLAPDQLLNVKFEDLLRSPHETLREMIRFIDPSLENEAWLNEVAALPQPTPSRFTRLPDDERQALTAACAPGLQRLGYPL